MNTSVACLFTRRVFLINARQTWYRTRSDRYLYLTLTFVEIIVYIQFFAFVSQHIVSIVSEEREREREKTEKLSLNDGNRVLEKSPTSYEEAIIGNFLPCIHLKKLEIARYGKQSLYPYLRKQSEGTTSVGSTNLNLICRETELLLLRNSTM